MTMAKKKKIINTIPFEQYPIFDQWINNDCSVKKLSENTVKDETLKHPSLANTKFNLAKAADAIYKDFEKIFDDFFMNRAINRFYKCFDLEKFDSKYTPVLAYIAKRHYYYRIYKYRFGIHQNSYEGSYFDFFKPSTYIKELLLNEKTLLPITVTSEAMFDDILQLALHVAVGTTKDIIVHDGICYGIRSLDTICNLCKYDMNYLYIHKDKVLHIFKEYKGYKDISSNNNNMIEAIKKKGCLYCVKSKDMLIYTLTREI